jgi:hypothetical protein
MYKENKRRYNMLNQIVLIGRYKHKTPEGFVIELDGDDIYIHDPNDLFFSVGAVYSGDVIALKGKVKGMTKLGLDLFEEYRSIIHLERLSVIEKTDKQKIDNR